MIKRALLFTRLPFLFIPGCLYRNPCKDKATLENLIEGVDGRPEEELLISYYGADQGNSDRYLHHDKYNLILPLLENVHYQDVTDEEEIEKRKKEYYIAETCLIKSVNAFYLCPDRIHVAFFASQGGKLEEYYCYYNFKRVSEEDGKKILETIKAAYYKGYEHLYKKEESNSASKSARTINNSYSQTGQKEEKKKFSGTRE